MIGYLKLRLFPLAFLTWSLMGFASSADSVNQQRTTIVCFGDSTTARRGDLVIYADLLRAELSKNRPDVHIQNNGVGGSHTDHARARFERDVLKHEPTLAIIQFGINDSAVDVWKKPPATGPRVPLARYRKNLEFFVDTLREQGCRVILMTPNPLRWNEKTRELYGRPPYDPGDPDGFTLLLKDYAACVREIAEKKDVELVDVYSLYEAYDSRDGKSMDELLLDGMHPNAAGHRMVADRLKEKIYATSPARPRGWK